MTAPSTGLGTTRAKVASTSLVLSLALLGGCAATTTGGSRSEVPAAERQFLAAAREGQSAAKDSNEVKLVGERKQRNQALCEALGDSKQVADWLGKVSDVRTTMGGDKGVLTIEMDDDIEVGTWNNAVSDIGSHTLVETSDPLYAQIADLEKGDKVRFSGEFVADKHDCVRETSLTDRGGMRTPSFVMKFSAVSPTR